MRKINTIVAFVASLLILGADELANAQHGLAKLPATPEQLRQQLKDLQIAESLKPQDAQVHLKMGECLQKLGRLPQASEEFIKASKLDPHLYVAYHHLASTCTNEAQIDVAIEKLTALSVEKPKELLLRVALSELLEKRGNYYQAARTLIDMSFANTVPEKYKAKVTARIHNMLALSKSHKAHEAETAVLTSPNSDEELDVVPAPLPTPSSKRSLAHGRLKDSKEVRGMGHTPLIP